MRARPHNFGGKTLCTGRTSEGLGSNGEAVSAVSALELELDDNPGCPPSVGVSFSSVPLDILLQ